MAVSLVIGLVYLKACVITEASESTGWLICAELHDETRSKSVPCIIVYVFFI
jgi:hypothetical protein